MTVRRAILFGDPRGIPQLLEVVPREVVAGLVVAEIRNLQHDEVSKLAASLGVPLLVQPRYSSRSYSQFVVQVRNLALELILVNSYSMLIRNDILGIPGFNAINIHGALLPQYRGANPTQWALLNNETETGVTMHYMTEEFDAGDIIATRRVPIMFEDTWLDIGERQDEATEDMLALEIPKVLSRTNSRRPQDQSMARHYRRRHPSDGLIEWDRSVLYIYNLVRALVSPHPGAFYRQDGRKIVLDKYLYVAQVTRLKYSSTGGAQTLSIGDLCLTPLMEEDSRRLKESLGEQGRHLGWLAEIPADEKRLTEWLTNAEARNDVVVLAIREKGSEASVGLCWIDDIDHSRRTAELRVDLDKTHDAYLKDAVQLGIRYAFMDLELDQITTSMPNDQPTAAKLHKDLGFTAEGVLRRARYTASGTGM